MRISKVRRLVALTCLALITSGGVVAQTVEVVLSPTTPVSGRSQGEWSEKWWIWASSFPSDSSPISDRTGARCGAGQTGPVWFLAGAFGSALVERRCTIPRGAYLFFPLVNYVVTPDGTHPLTCDAATREARRVTESRTVLVAVVDDRKVADLAKYRQVSPDCFDLAAGAKVGVSVFPSAANGYFLMLSPLAPGRHSLRFGGELPTLRQAIRYELTVE